MKLTDEIITDDFVAGDDALKVRQPSNLKELPAAWCTIATNKDCEQMVVPANQIGAQSVGYGKAQARTLTLLAMLSIILEDGVTGVELQVLNKNCTRASCKSSPTCYISE